LNCFEEYYGQAVEAEEKLKDLELKPQDGVCHGDYNHHHVLMCGYEIATTNFECCRFDFQVNDLYRFMRKILEKHEWNPRLGMRMLERYTLERPISREERRLLTVRMLYPEKFRKLANYYYGSNKAWISGRFLEKLETLNRQEEKRRNFVRLLEK
jgi:Ser/Thr protein kinase RdoA (MazF antagonist)